MKGFDWSSVDAVVTRIPKGRWASYGDVARAAGLPVDYAKSLGAHLADADVDGAWRVLDARGRPSPRFRLGTIQASGDVAEVIAWLKEEGVRFDGVHARPNYRLDVRQLRQLK